MAKYRFRKEYSDAKIQVIGRRKLITKDTLIDEDVEFIKKRHPKLMHNFELDNGEPQDQGGGEFSLNEFLKIDYKKRVKAVKEMTNTDVLVEIRQNETSQTVVKAIDERLEALSVPDEGAEGDESGSEEEEED